MTVLASTQSAHLLLESIEDDVLCLSSDQYRAIIEVGATNYALQGETEQEAIIAGFAAVLNSLTFPIQILIRVLPIEVEGYLGDLEQRSRHLSDDLAELARDHVTFLRHLARNRTLLERRFYLIVPAHHDAADGWQPWPFRNRASTPNLDRMRPQLTFRCDELASQLGRCGLPTHRLSSVELVQLIHACWCPELARVQRLHTVAEAHTPIVQTLTTQGIS